MWQVMLLMPRLLASYCISACYRFLFVTHSVANPALQVLSEEYPLTSVICYCPSPISPVPSPFWLLLSLSPFWIYEPVLWELGTPPPASCTSYYFFASWQEELCSDTAVPQCDAFNGWLGCQIFESNVRRMFLASLNKYQETGVGSKCWDSRLPGEAAAFRSLATQNLIVACPCL